MCKKVIIFLLLLCYLLAVGAAEVVLWATSDVHGVINSPRGGLAKIFSVLEAKRKPEDLLIDVGDFFQGSYSANTSGGMSLLNIFHSMGYDFCVPGNHEMDIGMKKLREFYTLLKVPLLCANWKFVKALPNMKSHAVVVRNNIRIGIIGVGDRESRTRVLPGREAVFMKEEKAIAQSLAALRKEKVDIIVLVRHGGIYFSGGTLYSLLKLFPEIDVVIGGHSHQTERGRKIAGAYYIHPAPYGQGVSEVRIAFNERTRKIERISSFLHETESVKTSVKMKKYIDAERRTAFYGNVETAKNVLLQYKSVEDLQKYLTLKAVAELGSADAELFFIDKAGIDRKTKINDYMIYRMFPYENNVVQIKVSYKEYQSILAECRKYCDKYKVALINELHKSDKKYIILRTSSFILSGGGRNFPEARRIAENRKITEFASLRQLVKQYFMQLQE